MPERSRAKPESLVKTGKERINILFEQAEDVFRKDPALAHRYADLARKIAMRYNIRLGKVHRMRMCSECHHYIVPGENSTIRTSAVRHSILITCSDCGNVMRYPYKKEKQASKAHKSI
ncbi:MAG: ribonuclease P [Candidatus Aenigmatarchaeota archaeon]